MSAAPTASAHRACSIYRGSWTCRSVFFYDNMPDATMGGLPASANMVYGFADRQDGFGAEEALVKRETTELVRAYYRIVDPNVRKRMLDLIKSMGPVED